MAEWWNSLSVLMKILWAVTLSASLIFVIQSIMTFLGAAGDNGLDGGDINMGDGGLDADMSSDIGGDLAAGHADAADMGHAGNGMNLYTFRNLINFIMGFGWTAILLKGQVKSRLMLFLLATIVGLALVGIVMYMFIILARTQQSGNINLYKSAVGCQGTTYLTIPAERTGAGKVQISINNAIREYDAMTDGDTIKTGTPIKVTEVLNDSTLLVEELRSLIV